MQPAIAIDGVAWFVRVFVCLLSVCLLVTFVIPT